MIPAITPRQTTMIVNNILDVLQSKNIGLLTKQSYNFLHLCSGFIAHYSRLGFMDYYQDTAKLIGDLLYNQDMNQWDNFHPGDENYEYCMSKKRTYNTILSRLTAT